MIYFDPIIKNLQKYGGVTVYFEQLWNYCNKYNVGYKLVESSQSKYLRYFDVNVRGTISKDDIFHSTYYRLPKNNMKVVTTVHDFTYEKYVKGIKRTIHSYQKNRAIKDSDAIICVSKNTANDLLHYVDGIDESKIHVVHNGVSEKYYPLFNVKKTNEVIYIGARVSYKNFDKAIFAVSKSPELILSIVGGGVLSENELKLLNKYLPNRYKVYGSLTEDELNNVYNRAFCLLYPSSYEGFGIPILEAMKAGCPVIAVATSSIPEVAGNATLLSNSTDVDELHYLLEQLLDNKIVNKLVTLGFEQSACFSWEKSFLQTRIIYNKLSN